jgi:hypothetical protein
MNTLIKQNNQLSNNSHNYIIFNEHFKNHTSILIVNQNIL